MIICGDGISDENPFFYGLDIKYIAIARVVRRELQFLQYTFITFGIFVVCMFVLMIIINLCYKFYRINYKILL